MTDPQRDDSIFAALVGATLLAVILLGRACTVGAQPTVDPELLRDALRVRISEADFAPECVGGRPDNPRGCVTDGAAIVERHVAAAERRGTSLHVELRRYSRRATGQAPPRSPRGAWVAALTLDFADPPAGFPAGSSWDRRRPLLEQIAGQVEQIVAAALGGSPRRVCAEPVDHWGGQVCDGSRRGACDRVPRCWRPVDCGPTVNAFYRVECPRIRTLPASVARGRR